MTRNLRAQEENSAIQFLKRNFWEARVHCARSKGKPAVETRGDEACIRIALQSWSIFLGQEDSGNLVLLLERS